MRGLDQIAYFSSSNSPLASLRSSVSKPSVNQSQTGARRSWASLVLSFFCQKRTSEPALAEAADGEAVRFEQLGLFYSRLYTAHLQHDSPWPASSITPIAPASIVPTTISGSSSGPA